MWDFCDVYDDVFLCCPFFPRDVVDEILDLIESVSEGFPTDSYNMLNYLFSGEVWTSRFSPCGCSLRH